MRHQLGAEVTEREEVIRPYNQLSIFLVKHRQAVETGRNLKNPCFIVFAAV